MIAIPPEPTPPPEPPKVHEQRLRAAVRRMDPQRAALIEGAYHDALDALKDLASLLELADLDDTNQRHHPLLNEHLIICEVLDVLDKSQLGRVL